MLIITLQRAKCIGCNYCVEQAPQYFQMSKKDGKAVLIASKERSGFHTLKTKTHTDYEVCQSASRACPVKIIDVKIS